jgi:tripartite-type tricarboxylate transporter receptor subunit TctC
MQKISRRSALALTLSLALACAAAAGPTFAADAYPSKPIRLVVPFPPGGGTDAIARDVANELTTTLKWNFVVENRPGSGGNIGVDAAAKSAPDGYTIVLGQTSNLAINPTLYGHLPYDPLKDLTPVALVASAPLVFVVKADSPYKNLADLVAAAKAKPGTLNFASPGNGTVTHLTGELLQKEAGVTFTHVPYKGGSMALTDLLGGRVQIYAGSVPTLLGHIKSGQLRAIVVTSAQRDPNLPQVPTVGETYKGFEAVTWFGFVAPAGTPQPIVAKLNAEINKALKTPELKKRLNDEGATVLGGSPEQFGTLIKSEIAKWAPVVKASGAHID